LYFRSLSVSQYLFLYGLQIDPDKNLTTHTGPNLATTTGARLKIMELLFFIHKEIFRVPTLLRRDTHIKLGTLQQEMFAFPKPVLLLKAGMTDSTSVGVFS
jgi:hypothetical protein